MQALPATNTREWLRGGHYRRVGWRRAWWGERGRAQFGRQQKRVGFLTTLVSWAAVLWTQDVYFWPGYTIFCPMTKNYFKPKSSYQMPGKNLSRIPMFRIRNSFVRTLILGSAPLTNESGSYSFRQRLSRCKQKKKNFSKFSSLLLFNGTFHSPQIKSHNEVTK